MENQPKLVFITGINGAGKSTLTDEIREINDNTVIINPDEFSKKYKGFAENIANLKGGREALSLFKSALTDKKDIIIETTLSGNTVFNRYEQARKLGYHITTMYVGLDAVEKHIERVADRVRNGGHHIAEELIRKRYSQREERLFRAFQKSDKFIAYDNSDFNRVIAFTYQKETPQLLQVYSDKLWIKTITNKLAKQENLTIECKFS